MQDFHRVIGKAVLDENFRAQLLSNPNEALQGFNLSPEEIQTLQNMSPEQFNALAEQFGQQLPGVDVLKHKMSADLFPKQGGIDQAAVDYFIKGESAGNPAGAQVDYFIKGESAGNPAGAQVDYFIKGESAGNPAGAQVDYYKKLNPDPGDMNFAKQADLIKGEANFQKVMPGAAQGGPSPHMFTGGVRSLRQSLGLVVIAIIAILIGLLLFFVFAPLGTINGGMQAMSLNFTCPSDPSMGEIQMGDGSVRFLGGGVFVAAGDVNGDGANGIIGEDSSQPSAGPGGGEWIELESFSWGELESWSWGELHFDDGLFNFADGMLNFTNILRITMGGQPFLPLCGAPPADPDEGGEMANEGDGGTTGGGQPTGGTTGGQQPPPDDNQPPPDDSLCANNGGIQWQGTACVCPGLVDNVTMCADGTKIDQVTDQACTPEQACDQPTDPQNPPAACACTFVCTQSALAAVGQCSQGVWIDCNGAVCKP